MNLDRKITIQNKTVTVDGYGDDREAWVDWKRVSVSYKPLSDAEKQNFGIFGIEAGRFILRRFNGFEERITGARFLFNGRIFGVEGVKEIGRAGYIEVTAKNVDNR